MMMNWSHVETRGLAIKSARGSGMPWGLAEEAGFAVEWLETRGLPGVEAIANLLEEIDGYTDNDRGQCPINLGATISDTSQWKPFFPAQIHQPVLLLPFLSLVAEGGGLGLEWGGNMVPVNQTGVAGGLSQSAVAPGLHECNCRDDVVTAATVYQMPRVADDRAAYIKILERFAHRTYAPATEESRAKGAGAGLTDND